MNWRLTGAVLFLAGSLVVTGCKASTEQQILSGNPTQAQSNTVTEPSISEGEAYAQNFEKTRPVAVMLDNHAGARPQAGLKDAEIVIEALAEGNITRYMAFFFSGMPESVGPIRSARPYFIDRSMEYDAVYVHIGGSPKALSDIKKLKVNDLDGLSSSNKVFFRKSHKKMPHNAYSTMEILRAEAEKRHYDTAPSGAPYTFNNEDTAPTGEVGTFIKLPYRKNDGGYIVSYSYDETSKRYTRSINGKVHVDEIDQSPMTAKNIIVQYVPTKVVDDAGRLDLELVGSGNGYYLSDGVKVAILWHKDSRSDKTIYTLGDGTVLSLNPGNTWIQIIPKSMTIVWES